MSFFKATIFTDLDKVEQQLGCDVFKLSELIKEGHFSNEIEQLLRLEDNQSQSLSLSQKEQIARILSLCGWAFKFASRSKEEVFNCLKSCEKYALTEQSRALLLYVQSSVCRGYGDFHQSEAKIRSMLDEYLKESSLSKAHALNNLGLALLRTNLVKDAEKAFKEALVMSSQPQRTILDRILESAEGAVISRTETNLAQTYLKTGDLGRARDLAIQSLNRKNRAEDIAYGSMVVGEILTQLANDSTQKSEMQNAKSHFESGSSYMCKAQSLYEKIYAPKPNMNHLRSIIGLAECYKKLNKTEFIDCFNRADNIARQLNLNNDHDFMKRLETMRLDLRAFRPN